MNEENLNRIAETLDAYQDSVWITGGAVRDAFMHITPKDIDLVTRSPDALAEKLAAALHANCAVLHKTGDVIRITLPETAISLDIARMRGDTIAEDLAMRDFTINAIAMTAARETLFSVMRCNIPGLDMRAIDPYHGAQDIAKQILRPVSNTIFQDDPFRIFRAARLQSRFHLTFTEDLIAMARTSAGQLMRHASSRIAGEFFLLLQQEGTGAQPILALDALGGLQQIIPELEACRGLRQGRLHYYTVFDHTMAVLDFTDKLPEFLRAGLSGDIPDAEQTDASCPQHPIGLRFGSHNTAILEYLQQPYANGQTRFTLMKTAALLHDIAKPNTIVHKENGYTAFPDHPEAGEPIARKIMKRMQASSASQEYAARITKLHMEPSRSIFAYGGATQAALRAYCAITENFALDTGMFSLADHLGVYGPAPLNAYWRKHYTYVSGLAAAYFTNYAELFPQPLISGGEIIERFGAVPGPQIAELLQSVRAAQIQYTIQTTHEAYTMVERLLRETQTENSADTDVL